MNNDNSDDLEKNVDRIVNFIMDKKGENIVTLDLRGITGVADFFVIASGNSSVHVKAIADEVHDKMKKEYGTISWHVEGNEAQKWMLIDYVDIVVHIFDYESRDYYSLDKLWVDAKTKKYETNY